MPYIDLPNFQLHYQQFGAGTSLVFLHGLSLDNRMWQPQYDSFSDEYLCLGLDFRGHGNSDAPDTDYSLDTYTEDLSVLLNLLHIPATTLVGLSMGGAVALNFVLQYPQRVNSLALVSSALDGHQWSAAWQSVMDRLRGVDTLPALRSNLRQYWLNDPMFEHISRKIRYAKLLRLMASSFSGKPILHGSLDSTIDPPANERLREITCPVCVINGQDDRYDFRQIGRRLATAIPRVEWHTFPDTGHMVNLEQEEKFNEILHSFLVRADSGGI